LWECYAASMPKKSGLATPREAQIGERVRRFREQIKWPQSAFADELGISRDKLASIEYGRTPLRYAIGYRLCFIFDVNYRWLASGSGEMKAATASLEMPRPEGIPGRALFSAVCAKAGQGNGWRLAEEPGKTKEKAEDLIPNFDATAHVIDFLSDLFAKEKLKSPVERQEFALEITSHARELAMRARRTRAKESYRAASKSRRADGAARNAGAAGLQESVGRLERDVEKLVVMVGKLCSAKSSAARKGSEMEMARLRDAVDKIAGQIAEAEAAIRISLF
jgi:transcriptional regulator with XRE-family HTH domain